MFDKIFWPAGNCLRKQAKKGDFRHFAENGYKKYYKKSTKNNTSAPPPPPLNPLVCDFNLDESEGLGREIIMCAIFIVAS